MRPVAAMWRFCCWRRFRAWDFPQISPQRPAQGATASVELRAEQAHVEVTLELAGSAAIEVVVESSEGTPRDDVRVSASVEGGVGIE